MVARVLDRVQVEVRVPRLVTVRTVVDRVEIVPANVLGSPAARPVAATEAIEMIEMIEMIVTTEVIETIGVGRGNGTIARTKTAVHQGFQLRPEIWLAKPWLKLIVVPTPT
jgi:hypothetical protein